MAFFDSCTGNPTNAPHATNASQVPNPAGTRPACPQLLGPSARCAIATWDRRSSDVWRRHLCCMDAAAARRNPSGAAIGQSSRTQRGAMRRESAGPARIRASLVGRLPHGSGADSDNNRWADGSASLLL